MTEWIPEKITKKIVISNDDNYDLPDNLIQFIEYFQEKLSIIPEEYREFADIEIDCCEYSGEFKVSYTRDETDEEQSKRLASINDRLVERRDSLKAQLEKVNKQLGE